MPMNTDQLTAAEVASHLGNPEGALGRVVGEWMAKNNALICKKAYARLQVNHGDRVLEIGPGNGALVGHVVTNDNDVTYVGIDISQTMVDAAREYNSEMVAKDRVDFVLASAESIPFPSDSFDRAVTVNSIYFWNAPKALREIHRVLVSGGRLVVASNSPETMASNPFVKLSNSHKNISLDESRLEHLHTIAGFSNVTIEEYTEDATRIDGTPYVRKSFMTIAIK
jgi:SAM-dependent methyltransferase